jgi:hypothetical protein
MAAVLAPSSIPVPDPAIDVRGIPEDDEFPVELPPMTLTSPPEPDGRP